MPLSRYVLAASMVACSAPATPPTSAAKKPPTPLGLLMKNEVNPIFSKLSFLAFHGENAIEDPAVLASELQTASAALKTATARVRVWPDPPVTSAEGREVFYALSTSVDKFTGRLVEAAGKNDLPTAQKQLELIAKACNDCHHFFRLNIEDSVVGPGAPAPAGM